MKKNNFSKGVLIVTLLFSTIFVYGQDKIISYSDVPSQIQSYIKKHFPKNQVLQSKVDYEGLTKEYEIVLSESIKLEFNKKNNIKSIQAKSKLPESVIPFKIREYVKAHYKNNFIIEWEMDRTHQSVELDNKIELEFTLKGDFLRIDN